jgi:hypothetical protein
MLFKFMSQTLSLKDFEIWLYNDDYVNSQLFEINYFITQNNCVVMFFLCTINKTTTQSLMQFGVGEFTKK